MEEKYKNISSNNSEEEKNRIENRQEILEMEEVLVILALFLYEYLF